MNFKALAAATLLVCANTSFAQGAAPATSAAKKAQVAKLVQLHQPAVEALAQNLLQAPIGNLMQGAAAALRQMPADKREAAAKAIEADIKKFVDETTPLLRERGNKAAPETIGKLFEERFSEEELAQLITWLESPISKKYGQLSGEMQKQLSEKVVGDSRNTIETRLRTLEQNVMKHLGMQAKPANAPDSAPAKK
ncbi:hypothetical protein [Roseateles sp.]|uniref:hypothetical protein n=1 Tax=Roseateles sp. TaxID=1971397 RepID=UPI0037C93796